MKSGRLLEVGGNKGIMALSKVIRTVQSRMREEGGSVCG